MAFNGTEGKIVTLSEASEWTENYRDTIPEGGIKGHFFGKDLLDEILKQPGCMGIRIYYGMEDDGTKNLVLVGADANEEDMEDGVILERSVKCPPNCGGSSQLNS
jgi:hypothetical protein